MPPTCIFCIVIENMFFFSGWWNTLWTFRTSILQPSGQSGFYDHWKPSTESQVSSPICSNMPYIYYGFSFVLMVEKTCPKLLMCSFSQTMFIFVNRPCCKSVLFCCLGSSWVLLRTMRVQHKICLLLPRS